jgi:PAS domain S-box-containing protein
MIRLHVWPSMLQRAMARMRRARTVESPGQGGLGWRALPRAAQQYVAAVIVAGACAAVALFPRVWPPPILFGAMLAGSCLTASWKVNLPISLASGSTLSLSNATNLMALLILGPSPAILVAIASAWTQCTFNVRQPYPWYRTVFSMAAEAITVAATGVAYTSLGGLVPPVDVMALSKPLAGAIATYFLVNTGLVAGAIALSLGQSVWRVWHDDFLWGGPSFTAAGAFGVLGAVAIATGRQWAALLMVAPVYLTFRTYRLFLGRLEEQRRHIEETQRLHEDAVDALQQARRAEQALAAEKERLAVTLRSIADGIITTDLDGTIVSINSVAETLTGWTEREAAGHPLAAVFRNVDPETRELCDNSVATLLASSRAPGPSRCTILVARDLAERPIEEGAASVCDADGHAIGMVVAFRDITDALRIQEERAKASRLASLGLLAGGIAHDFNNVLLAILGNVSIARATMPRAEAAADALAEAEQACVRARQLTWQLLTFSKGGVPVKKTVVVSRALRESAALVLRGSTASFTLDCSPDLWSVQADEGQLTQVFSNVLVNAGQAMPHGGPITVTATNIYEPEARSQYGLRISPGPYVRVSIADKGIGIPREHLDRIFDPYFTTKQRGSGLGLATAYSIVKNHGGFVSVDSHLGGGTTMHITLPATAVCEVPEAAASWRPGRGGRQRVLVMDDEESVRTLALNMLEFLGYDGEVVDSGSAAVDRFARALQGGQPFDVVILDLMVPAGVGAKEAMDRLAAIDPSVKGIVMSGYVQDSALTDFRTHGFQAAISKPFTLQELSATLQTVVESPARWVH